MTVLVVDDDEDVVRLAEIILLAAGYHVLCASGSEDALELAEEYPGIIHLLLTDVRMQTGQDGYDLAQAVRQTRSHIKVLYMSGFTDDERIHREIADAKSGFVLKPFKRQTLLNRVIEILGDAADGAEIP